MAGAIGHEPSLDLTVKSDAAQWASRLHGETLPTGSVRTLLQGSVTMLPGFSDGQWWVQDAAAALPVRLFGDIKGKTIADLCAAPGGKTAQLALAGADVTAIDRSPARVARLRDNFARLKLEAETLVTDAVEWKADGEFDGILVDAPCTSTGTIRRHPDVAWLRQEADMAPLVALQKRLLQKAVSLLKPGGTLGLLHLLAGARGRRRGDRGPSFKQIWHPADADRSRRGRGPRRNPHQRGRFAHPALPFAAPGPAAWRAGRILRGQVS